MLLGFPGVKVDTWIRKFVDRVCTEAKVDSPKTDVEIRASIDAARQLAGIAAGLTETDHAIWRYERGRKK